MTIQFNTDKTISGIEDNTAPFIALITEELSRFSSQITRIEVHLSDENGNKDEKEDEDENECEEEKDDENKCESKEDKKII